MLLWLLVKEPDFKVPSQYSWAIFAKHPFKLSGIERKVTARAEPLTKAHTYQSKQEALPKKKAVAKRHHEVVCGSDANSSANTYSKQLDQPAPEGCGTQWS